LKLDFEGFTKLNLEESRVFQKLGFEEFPDKLGKGKVEP